MCWLSSINIDVKSDASGFYDDGWRWAKGNKTVIAYNWPAVRYYTSVQILNEINGYYVHHKVNIKNRIAIGVLYLSSVIFLTL